MTDIGIIQGKMLVFGGVYSNLQALQALKMTSETEGIAPSNIICTGDIIAYCAQPIECIEFIMDWGIHLIAGNVELNLLDQADDCGCNFNEGSRCDVFSRQWYPFIQSKLSEKHLAFLQTIPNQLTFVYAKQKVMVIHGGIDNVSRYIFKSTDWSEKEQLMEKHQVDIILAGHCGLPFQDINNGKRWINAGVIGMPANDGKKNTWYLLMDEKEGELEVAFKKLTYDHEVASQKMKELGLVPAYAKTLTTGIWDNCEILPEYESSQQGHEINLSASLL